MKTFKQWIALLCAASMLFSLAGCSEPAAEETKQDTSAAANTADPAETEAETEDDGSLFKTVKDDLPEDLKLEGRTVTFLSRGREQNIGEIHVEEMTGEVVNDAVFQREIAVEDRLDCKIENIATGTDSHGNELLTMVSTSVTASDGAYDILANSNWSTANTYPTGYYLNLYDVENLNLDKEYWAQHLIESTEINGALFGVAGSLGLYMYQSLFAVFFNRNLCEQYGIMPDDVYSMVFEGKWTLDQMIAMTKDIYQDKDGNGIADENDVYGYGLQVSSSTDGYWSSCQVRMTSRDNDGVVKLDTDVEKLVSVVERLQDFAYNQKGVIRLVEASDMADGFYLPEAFAKDQILFMNDWIYTTGTGVFRDMESDYGIIPYPKYDEAQDDYYSYIHDAYTTFSILCTVDEPAVVGAVMEAMASDSHNRVIPAYYETALSQKYARDQDSVTSLQTIFKNAYLDTGWVYSLNMNQYPQGTLREPVWRNTSTTVTYVARMGKMAEKSLEKIMKSFDKITDQ